MTAANPGAIPRRGYFYVIVAALMWGVSGAAGKFLFHQGITPSHLVQLRVTLSAVLLFLCILTVRRSLLVILPRDLLYFSVLGITGMAMVQFFYFYAISKIHVAVAVLLEYLAPVFIALYYIFVARDKPTRTTLTAIGISVLGCYLAVGAYNFDLLALNGTGIAAGILAGIAYAWYAVYGEKGMRTYSPWTVVFYAFLFSAFCWNVAVAPLEAFRVSYSAVEWFWIFYITVFGTFVPYGLYSMGISLIRSTRASITAMLEPIAAGFLAYVFLGESLEPPQVFGGCLVIAALVLLQARREYDENTSALIRKRRGERAQIPS